MVRRFCSWVLCGLCALTGALLVPSANAAQSRTSDSDVASMMRNLADDAKSFRPLFEADVHQSAIRKTSREKDATNLAASFATQTETMLTQFKSMSQGDSELATVRSTAQQIDTLVRTLKLGPETAARWTKIQTELDRVSGAFGIGSVRTGENPEHTSSYTPSASSPASGPSCAQAVGPVKSKRLVENCLAVSPATHPPCNAQNSCALIIDEIKRSCAMLDARSAPAFCKEYK